MGKPPGSWPSMGGRTKPGLLSWHQVEGPQDTVAGQAGRRLGGPEALSSVSPGAHRRLAPDQRAPHGPCPVRGAGGTRPLAGQHIHQGPCGGHRHRLAAPCAAPSASGRRPGQCRAQSTAAMGPQPPSITPPGWEGGHCAATSTVSQVDHTPPSADHSSLGEHLPNPSTCQACHGQTTLCPRGSRAGDGEADGQKD